MSRHVLVAVDGTDPATGALAYALASFPDATLTAVCVDDPSAGAAETAPDCEDVLERATALADDCGRDLRTERRRGDPHAEILAAATDADHVVLGTHGGSTGSRPFLGGVSERVVRRAPVTTTVVPESADAVRDRDLPGRVLVAVDGSEQAAAALEYALEAFPDASHAAVHVVSLPFDHDREVASGSYLDRIRTAHERTATDVLESAAATAADRGIDLETRTVYGDPEAEIVATAADDGFDQIVTGIHGQSLTTRLFTGSVAEQVARRAPCPATLVRGDPSLE